MNLIQVVSVSEVKTAKNNRPYKVVSFKEMEKTIVLNGRNVNVKTNSPNRTRLLWGEGVTEDSILIKADALYNDIKVGDVVEGSFHTLPTTEYTIGIGESARVVSSYSCVVFGNEDVVSYANRQLKSNDANVINTEAVHLIPQEAPKAF
jgi:hypothetical protein